MTKYGICDECGQLTIFDGSNITCTNDGLKNASEDELAIAGGKDPTPCKRSELVYTIAQWKALGVKGE